MYASFGSIGCGDASHQFNRFDSLSGLKLRPLMSGPAPVTPTNNPCPAMPIPSCCTALHHQANTKEQGKGDDMTNNVGLVSSRWSPTPEQLHALEEMFRGGIRTPTANQIQQIAAKLRRFGKIEGKNVFYWFQNHKARERQKLRHLLATCPSSALQQQNLIETKDSGFEAGQGKKRATSSNCSTLSEDLATMKKHKAKEISEERWIQSLNTPCVMGSRNIIDSTYFEDYKSREIQTLQLFPGWNDQDRCLFVNAENKDAGAPLTTVDETCRFTPSQFFEFLPPKD
ncbi:hypothetical protein NMG60_11018820 [Bertholletia excelsa]